MHDGADPMARGQAGDEAHIAGIAFDEVRAARHQPALRCRKVIEHHRGETRLEQGEHRVAADIAGATRDQNGLRHQFHPGGGGRLAMPRHGLECETKRRRDGEAASCRLYSSVSACRHSMVASGR